MGEHTNIGLGWVPGEPAVGEVEVQMLDRAPKRVDELVDRVHIVEQHVREAHDARSAPRRHLQRGQQRRQLRARARREGHRRDVRRRRDWRGERREVVDGEDADEREVIDAREGVEQLAERRPAQARPFDLELRHRERVCTSVLWNPLHTTRTVRFWDVQAEPVQHDHLQLRQWPQEAPEHRDIQRTRWRHEIPTLDLDRPDVPRYPRAALEEIDQRAYLALVVRRVVLAERAEQADGQRREEVEGRPGEEPGADG